MVLDASRYALFRAGNVAANGAGLGTVYLDVIGERRRTPRTQEHNGCPRATKLDHRSKSYGCV